MAESSHFPRSVETGPLSSSKRIIFLVSCLLALAAGLVSVAQHQGLLSPLVGDAVFWGLGYVWVGCLLAGAREALANPAWRLPIWCAALCLLIAGALDITHEIPAIQDVAVFGSESAGHDALKRTFLVLGCAAFFVAVSLILFSLRVTSRDLEAARRDLEATSKSFEEVDADRQDVDAMSRFVSDRTIAVTGLEYLHLLAETLGERLGLRYVLIEEKAASEGASSDEARTVVHWTDGVVLEGMEADTDDGPFQAVFDGSKVFVPEGAKDRYPRFAPFVELKAQGYYGIPLIGAGEDVLGQISLIDDKPLDPMVRERRGLDLLALRAARELERLRADERLRRSEAKAREAYSELDLLFKTAPVGLCSFDTDLRFLRVNDALAEFQGISPADHIGKTIAEVDPQLAAVVVPLLERVVATGESMLHLQVRGETIRDESAGRRYQTSMLPTRSLDGRISGVSVVVSDVTVFEQARQSEDRARRLESLVSLSSGVAHDFNNLLTGVLANADLARRKISKGAIVDEEIGFIESAARRASDLTNQLLSFTGRGSYQIDTLDLGATVAAVVSHLRSTAAHGVRIDLDVEKDLPSIHGDDYQISRILTEILQNAVESLERGQGSISICVESVVLDASFLSKCEFGSDLVPGEYLAVRVRDTGVGMDPATRSRAFEPFFTTKFTGRGLGLAAARGVLTAHAAAVRVESEPGHGSTFTLVFPAILSDAATAKRSTPAEVEGVVSEAETTVLVIDDDPHVLTATSRVLEYAGYSVSTSSSGAAGVDLFREQPDRISAVLVDLTMPGMNGVETLERLRQLDATVPVVLSSGYGESDIVEKYAKTGFAGFLQKPFDVTLLLETIEAVIER